MLALCDQLILPSSRFSKHEKNVLSKFYISYNNYKSFKIIYLIFINKI